MNEYETVTIFRAWVEVIDTLKTDAERGKLYHAICRCSLYGEAPQLDGVLGAFFTLMQPSVDESDRRACRDDMKKTTAPPERNKS